jgi:hypothetical protein
VRIISPFSVDTLRLKVCVVYILGYFFYKTVGYKEEIFGVDFGEPIEEGSGVSNLLGVKPRLIRHGVGFYML